MNHKNKTKKYERVFTVPKGSFFLFGPRGTGKTTLIEDLAIAEYNISLLDEGRYQSYLAQPSLFFEELNLLKDGSRIFVDEIQRLPSLLNEVHRLIEKKKFKFILTGSSARKLRRAGVNLLAGRAVTRHLYPLTPMEMGEDFDLDWALHFGTLPLVIQSEEPEETLSSYAQTYLKEEIQAESLVKNLGGFSRFLTIAALYHGQTLNLSNIARDSEVQRPTVQGFFEVLMDTLLADKLDAFTAHLSVREKKKPKFFFVDPGIVRVLKKQFGPPSPEERGPLFEGLIFTLLKFQKHAFGDIDDIYYWSPAEAKLTEVDFLIQQGKKFTAIEVKSSEIVRPSDLNGLKAITTLKGLQRRILVYRGKVDRKTEDKIEILSFSSFCHQLAQRKI